MSHDTDHAGNASPSKTLAHRANHSDRPIGPQWPGSKPVTDGGVVAEPCRRALASLSHCATSGRLQSVAASPGRARVLDLRNCMHRAAEAARAVDGTVDGAVQSSPAPGLQITPVRSCYPARCGVRLRAVARGATEAAGFLQELGERGVEPLWAKVSGSARVKLRAGGDVDTWTVAIDHGAVSVSHGEGPADCTILADRELFDRLCRGEDNAMAAMLRGALVCSGDVELLYAMQRIFPGPVRTGRP
jgi:hypothetical protein